MKDKIIIAVFPALAAALVSCGDMFENIEKHVSQEIIYVEKLDDLPVTQSVHYGYERVEIDLLAAGRIPSSHIRMNKAKYTVIECEDFSEPGHRRVIDSICSWVNVTGLTQLKTYRLTIYTEDDAGNRSLPLVRDVRPYTKENLDALGLVAPSVIESTGSALVEWKERISAKTHTVLDYAYSYLDKDNEEHTGEGEGDTPSFFVENVEKAKDIPIVMTCRTRPTMLSADGVNYKYILDTVEWRTSVAIRISENAEPAIFLKTPGPVVTVDLYEADDFPIHFTWINVPEVTNYTLKISTDPNFPDADTYSIDVANLSEYMIDATEGLAIADSFKRGRTVALYWTVAPAVSIQGVRTQTRRVDVSRQPMIKGQWLFQDETNIGTAAIGEDLIPTGSTITPIEGPTPDNKAVRVGKGSYFKALHGLEAGADCFTVKFLISFPVWSVAHPLLNTETVNDTELLITAAGAPGINGIGSAAASYHIGPSQWHEVVITSDGAAKKIFVDGEYVLGGSSDNARYNLREDGVWFFAEAATGNDNEVDVAEITMWDLPLTELEIHASSGVKKTDRTGWSAPYVSAADAAGPVGNLFDGMVTTYWYSSLPAPHQIVVDMASSRNLSRIIIFASAWGAANPKTVQVSVGNQSNPDVAAWTEVGELMRIGTSYTPAGSLMTFALPTPIKARYLKIFMPDRYGAQNVLGEIYVYEKVE